MRGILHPERCAIIPGIFRGRLRIADATVDFRGGRGYIEKDWGQTLPSA